jgi:hypothetical protein
MCKQICVYSNRATKSIGPPKHRNPIMAMASQIQKCYYVVGHRKQKSYYIDGVPNTEILSCRWRPKHRNPIMSMASKPQKSNHVHGFPIYIACITCHLTLNLLRAELGWGPYDVSDKLNSISSGLAWHVIHNGRVINMHSTTETH